MNKADDAPDRDSHHSGCPKAERWEQWICDPEDSPLENDSLAGHLDHCETCRSAVARVTQSDAFFGVSRDALRSSGLSSDDWRHLGRAAEQELSPTDTDSPLVSIVQSLLGASDDDRSLGRMGRFEVLGIVGAGGMGIVLKARSIDMDRIVAIKIPQPQYWRSTDLLSTLEREARSASSVVHPNVISIYHVDRYRDVPYLVMPWLPGQSLQQRLQRVGQLPVEEVVTIARQVASALSAAHACGVVHRDVKPANILLGTGTDRVVLSDFGLAKVGADATRTATGMFAGTPLYLSPEQASGQPVGPASDLYSLGTVIWTLLCGVPPMAGMHAHAIVRRIADAQIPPLTEHRDECPVWLQVLVDRLHAESPSDRPSANELTTWLETCQQFLKDPASTDLPDALSAERSRGIAAIKLSHQTRMKRTVVLLATATLAAVLFFGLPYMVDRETSTPSRLPQKSATASVPTDSANKDSANKDSANKDSANKDSANKEKWANAAPSPSSTGLEGDIPNRPRELPFTTSIPKQASPQPSKAVSRKIDEELNSVRDELNEVLESKLPDWEQRLNRLEAVP